MTALQRSFRLIHGLTSLLNKVMTSVKLSDWMQTGMRAITQYGLELTMRSLPQIAALSIQAVLTICTTLTIVTHRTKKFTKYVTATITSVVSLILKTLPFTFKINGRLQIRS